MFKIVLSLMVLSYCVAHPTGRVKREVELEIDDELDRYFINLRDLLYLLTSPILSGI